MVCGADVAHGTRADATWHARPRGRAADVGYFKGRYVYEYDDILSEIILQIIEGSMIDIPMRVLILKEVMIGKIII